MCIFENIHPDILAKTQKINDSNSSAGISVLMHCAIVGIVCNEVIKCIPDDMVKKYNLTKFALYCALHDIGKASPGFQEMLNITINHLKKTNDELSNQYVTKHEIVSREWLHHNHLEIPNGILATIFYHHGSNRSGKNTNYTWNRHTHSAYGDNKGDIKWDDIREDLYNSLLKIFPNCLDFCNSWSVDAIGYEYDTPIINSKVKYLTGLLTLCDWIGSDEKIFNQSELMTDLVDIEYIKNKAVLAIKKYGIDKLAVKKDFQFSDIWANFQNPTSIQLKLANLIEPHGVYIVEAPMGSGKTEAAEYAAYQAMQKGYVNGIYFALPTQTTSNSIFGRFCEFVQKICDYPEKDIRLIHCKSMFANDSNASDMKSWFTGKRAILSQFGLGTLDQALASVLGNIKHFYLRSFGLANKCVIIDEVHSYDAYTKRLGIELINQLVELDCIIIILSATLTANARNELIECGLDNVNKYPLITTKLGDDISYCGFNSKDINKEVAIKIQNVDNGVSNQVQLAKFIASRKKHIDECVERVKSGQMLLWIENTVSEATEVYIEFSRQVESGLLHARFTNSDRDINEKKWISRYGKGGDRSKGSILISTQVCEQSIDIDADYLITALCPTDMLLQRMGRLFRHPNKSRIFKPECLILANSNYNVFIKNQKMNLMQQFVNVAGPSAMVYHPYILRKTYRVLKDLKSINIPSDIRILLEKTYALEELNSIDEEFKQDFDNECKQFKQIASETMENSFGRDSDDDPIMNMPKSRLIMLPTIEVILCTEINGSNISTLHGVKINLNQIKNKFGKDQLHDLRAINDDSVKIYKSTVDKNLNVFRKIEVGNHTYTLAIVKNEMLVANDGTIQSMKYNSLVGFKK